AGGVLTLRLLLRSAAAEDPDTARRRFLALAGGVLVAGALAAALGRASLGRALQRAHRPAALPPPIEPVTAPGALQAFEVPGLTPIVVPNPDFYRIDVNLIVPRVQVDGWRLTVTGMVDREVGFTYEDLLGMPLVERYVTIACVSNEVGGGLVGNAAWTGVPLVDLLDRAGVQEDASQIVGRSVDGWTAGFPRELAYDGRDPLVAVGMNGEPLPASHGFPARLIVPGLYGYVSATKWLREIELTTLEAFDAFWIPRGWAKHGPVLTQSRIDVPRPGRVDAGPVMVAGVAWAPHVGIEKVEVRVDDGSWREAETTRPLSHDAWVQWRHRWDAARGRHALQVRATDRTGATQAAELSPPFPDGATGHHQVVVTVV
ncbi:MAG TPA: molybdopterin-dependent oxidoreductase, partial [Nitriliruptorales bacterium]|nr:molybdopterin-dependent oxidoreductase [Nitriliruptorales bacterium]